MQRAKTIGLIVATLFALTACTRADYQFFVRNSSDQTWLIRVDSGDENGTRVRRVAAHVEGLAFAWLGSRDVPVELLSEDCSVVGVFEPASDDRFVIPTVTGIDGKIEPYRFNAPWNVPGIGSTSECGGIVTY